MQMAIQALEEAKEQHLPRESSSSRYREGVESEGVDTLSKLSLAPGLRFVHTSGSQCFG